LTFFKGFDPVNSFGNERLALTKSDDQFQELSGLKKSASSAAISNRLH